MSNRDDFISEFAWGALIGGAVGAVATLLISSRSNVYVEKKPSFFSSKAKDVGKSPYVWGGVAGALLGAISGLFIVPRQKEVIHALSGKYKDINEKTTSLIDSLKQKSEEITEGIQTQTLDWADKTLDIADKIIEEVSLWEDTIRGAATEARAHTERISEPKRQEKVSEVLDWAHSALVQAENVTREVKSWAESFKELAENAKGRSSKPSRDEEKAEPKEQIQDVLDWISLGVSLWQGINKRR